MNMRDKVIQLIFQNNKSHEVLEVDNLKDSNRGNKEFGLSGINTTLESVNSVTKT